MNTWVLLSLPVVLLIGLSCIAATVLGWVAVSQIRNSKGRLRGLGLAVFDGLLFPLLVLDGVIIFLLGGALAEFFEQFRIDLNKPALALALLAALVVDWLIIRWVWRAVSRGKSTQTGLPPHHASESGPTPPAIEKGAHSRRPAAAVTSRLVAVLLAHGLAILAFVALLVFLVPRFAEVYAGFGAPLPVATRLVMSIADFLLHGGFLLVAVLLALDVAICWLLQKFAGLKALVAWGVLVLVGILACGAVSALVIYLPSTRLETGLDTTEAGSASESAQEGKRKTVFGPVIEQVLYSRLEGTTNWFLDFETGKVLMPPPGLAESLVRRQLESIPATRAMQFTDWVKRTGVDLAVYGPTAIETLGGIWMSAHGPTYKDWDDLAVLTPAQTLTAILAPERQETWSGRPELPGIGPKTVLSRDYSANYFFKTRDGTFGVLQLVGRDKTSGGLKLRYKMLRPIQSESAKTNALSVAGQLPAKEVAPSPGPAESTRATMNSVLAAVLTYEVDLGAYPTSLDALVRNPGNQDWKGPYMRTDGWPPTDAWGTPLRISIGEAPSSPTPIIISAGPDRKFGTADDLKEDGSAPESAQEGKTQPVFGPVIEQVVYDDGARRDFFVDLDTGKLFSPPAGLNLTDTNAVQTWLRENGIDAMGETGVSIHGLVGIEMVVRPLVSKLWGKISPQVVAKDEAIAAGTPGSPVFLRAKGKLPETFLFKTREGGMGVLQITGFTDNPRGVNIRYKLVQSPNKISTSVAAPDPAAAAAMVEEFKAHYGAAVAAMEKEDIGTAVASLRLIEAQKDDFVSMLDGLPIQKAVEGGLKQLSAVIKALDANDVEKAKTMMAGLDISGPAFERMIQEAAKESTHGQTQKRPTGQGVKPVTAVMDTSKAAGTKSNNPTTPEPIPPTAAADDSLQFRWVAAKGDTNSPADLLPDAKDPTGKRKLRVLREVVLSSRADVQSAGVRQFRSEQKEFEVFFSPRGGEKFARATAQNIGRRLAVVWRGKVISAPVVQTAITGRRLIITFRFTDAEAQQLLDVLNHRRPPHSRAKTEDLKARVRATEKVASFIERDELLAAIAADAARAGDAETTRLAVQKMTAFMSRDEAISNSARLLTAAGKRTEALELAKLATSFITRDALIKELAK